MTCITNRIILYLTEITGPRNQWHRGSKECANPQISTAFSATLLVTGKGLLWDYALNRSYFPFSHLALVVFISLGMVSFVAAKFNDGDTQRIDTSRVLDSLQVADAGQSSVPVLQQGLLSSGALNNPNDGDIATDPAASFNGADNGAEPNAAKTAGELASEARPPALDRLTHVEEVLAGDSLSTIFRRVGLSPAVLHRVMSSGPLAEQLTHIFPGHQLSFTTTSDNHLVQLDYASGPLETLQFTLEGDSFIGQKLNREPQRLSTYKKGVIDHSLFVASQRAGLADEVTMRLAQIFQWDIDFVLDIRKGDEFHVLYEELYLGEKFIGNGRILAAEFVNRKKTHQAILYTNETGEEHYYNPAGESMRKAFLRAPVSFSRISSNFNLRRKHPLFKTNKPHRGIDYAAPKGTPVVAAGDGRVVQASKNAASGNYIILQHGEQFTTKYLHLSKFARNLSKGKRVKQGETIGYVGRTGWATGPHLHYEFVVNGTHRNPRTVKLPNATPVPNAERARFVDQTSPYLNLLKQYREQHQVATHP